MGVAAPAVATGTALHRMEELAHEVLPPGIGFEWTELAFQQQQPGTPALLVFGAAALFVFLVLAGQYENWKLPLAVVMIVPMCLLASVTGLLVRGLPIDVLAEIGFVVLVGLAAKNAILIVEFARQAEEDGATPGEAAVSAARTRLRPILMASLAFILGVAPLVVATGAGAEMRQSLGTAVFSGMLGVTAFGLLFQRFMPWFARSAARQSSLSMPSMPIEAEGPSSRRSGVFACARSGAASGQTRWKEGEGPRPQSDASVCPSRPVYVRS
jgi:multidrug efflux pump subunit AcrB